MALNFLAFTQKRALGKSVAFEEVIKPKTPKLALKVSAFGVKDIIPTKVTPFAKTTTPAVPTIKPKPLKMEAFAGAVEKVVERLGQAPGIYTKIPFVQKEFVQPKG